MPDKSAPLEAPPLAEHGAAVLPSVSIDTYGAEIRDAEGFVGDRASNTAFREILDKWRKRLKEIDEDPLAVGEKKAARTRAKNGNGKGEKLSKRKLDRVLVTGDPKAAGLVVSAIEEFAQELAGVIRRFLKLKAWQGTEQIVIGGGFRNSRIGEVVIGRTEVLLKADDIDVSLVPIRHHPDEAGLIREAEKSKFGLAPFIGVGCPGLIEKDGAIRRGGQNLPGGNWESKNFNLPQALHEAVPETGGHSTVVLLRNDAVVQGLSEVPFRREVKHWAVLTVGTGLGNARFTNRE